MIVSLSVVNFNDEPSISKLKLTPTAAVRNVKTKNVKPRPSQGQGWDGSFWPRTGSWDHLSVRPNNQAL